VRKKIASENNNWIDWPHTVHGSGQKKPPFERLKAFEEYGQQRDQI